MHRMLWVSSCTGAEIIREQDGRAIPKESQPQDHGHHEVATERKLRPDEDHRRAARELLMQKYNASKRGNDFLRPLVYPPSGIV